MGSKRMPPARSPPPYPAIPDSAAKFPNLSALKMNLRELEELGDPDLVVSGLRVWIHGREFPDAIDYWDGNWLRVTAYCVYPHSMVRTRGPIIHLGEVLGLLAECEALSQTLSGRAALRCIEPNLTFELIGEAHGSVKLSLSITPDRLNELHKFEEEIDQTYLPAIIASCQAILLKYPVREPQALAAR
jgi:hypothetical protein